MTEPRSRFVDAADRLDRYITDVKSRQCEAAGTEFIPPPAGPAPGLHPDQAWEEAYAARTIRPRRRGEEAPAMPDFAMAPPSERPRFPAPATELRPPAGPIGSALGKKTAKRGWLARLFRP